MRILNSFILLLLQLLSRPLGSASAWTGGHSPQNTGSTNHHHPHTNSFHSSQTQSNTNGNGNPSTQHPGFRPSSLSISLKDKNNNNRPKDQTESSQTLYNHHHHGQLISAEVLPVRNIDISDLGSITLDDEYGTRSLGYANTGYRMRDPSSLSSGEIPATPEEIELSYNQSLVHLRSLSGQIPHEGGGGSFILPTPTPTISEQLLGFGSFFNGSQQLRMPILNVPQTQGDVYSTSSPFLLHNSGLGGGSGSRSLASSGFPAGLLNFPRGMRASVANVPLSIQQQELEKLGITTSSAPLDQFSVDVGIGSHSLLGASPLVATPTLASLPSPQVDNGAHLKSNFRPSEPDLSHYGIYSSWIPGGFQASYGPPGKLETTKTYVAPPPTSTAFSSFFTTPTASSPSLFQQDHHHLNLHHSHNHELLSHPKHKEEYKFIFVKGPETLLQDPKHQHQVHTTTNLGQSYIDYFNNHHNPQHFNPHADHLSAYLNNYYFPHQSHTSGDAAEALIANSPSSVSLRHTQKPLRKRKGKKTLEEEKSKETGSSSRGRSRDPDSRRSKKKKKYRKLKLPHNIRDKLIRSTPELMLSLARSQSYAASKLKKPLRVKASSLQEFFKAYGIDPPELRGGGSGSRESGSGKVTRSTTSWSSSKKQKEIEEEEEEVEEEEDSQEEQEEGEEDDEELESKEEPENGTKSTTTTPTPKTSSSSTITTTSTTTPKPFLALESNSITAAIISTTTSLPRMEEEPTTTTSPSSSTTKASPIIYPRTPGIIVMKDTNESFTPTIPTVPPLVPSSTTPIPVTSAPTESTTKPPTSAEEYIPPSTSTSEYFSSSEEYYDIYPGSTETILKTEEHTGNLGQDPSFLLHTNGHQKLPYHATPTNINKDRSDHILIPLYFESSKLSGNTNDSSSSTEYEEEMFMDNRHRKKDLSSSINKNKRKKKIKPSHARKLIKENRKEVHKVKKKKKSKKSKNYKTKAAFANMLK